jgi:hypothetical protein
LGRRRGKAKGGARLIALVSRKRAGKGLAERAGKRSLFSQGCFRRSRTPQGPSPPWVSHSLQYLCRCNPLPLLSLLESLRCRAPSPAQLVCSVLDRLTITVAHRKHPTYILRFLSWTPPSRLRCCPFTSPEPGPDSSFEILLLLLARGAAPESLS